VVLLNEKIAYFSLTQNRIERYKNISAPAIAVLVYIHENGKIDLSKVDNEIDKDILKLFLENLEKDNLVRHINPWELTPEGTKLAKEIEPEIKEIRKQIERELELRKILTSNPLLPLGQ